MSQQQAEDRSTQDARIAQRVADLVELEYPAVDELEGRECDLVMKGGITSGIVYPLAACELARTYRFRSIGGSSAGAIGAVMVAAAEKGRRTGGFQKLAAIPSELGPDLGSIFTPGPHTATALTALKGWLTPGDSRSSRIRRLVGTLRGAQRVRFWTAFGLMLVIGIGASLVAAGFPRDGGDWVQLGIVTVVLTLPVALAVALLIALVAEARSTLNNVSAQGFGICIGSDGREAGTKPRSGPGPFTDWMAAKIDEIAGVDRPLTVGDLWGDDHDDPDLTLRVMTTNLTQGRPQTFPFRTRTYLFDADELAAYLPPKVMERLMEGQAPATIKGQPLYAEEPPPRTTQPPQPPSVARRLMAPLRWLLGADRPQPAPSGPARPLYWLPPPEHLPVVLAARLSLSFPGLISAVPLWAVDYTNELGTPDEPRYGARRCWMTDGGLTANFPVHFFDSPLPGRPTFAIDLQAYPDRFPEQDVYYPGPGTSGIQPKFKTITSVHGFASGLLDTMQYWADTAQSALPGYRDRIVQVRLDAEEGGMNLKMPDAVVNRVAEKGRQAAEELTKKFEFDAHRWIRYLTVLGRMQVAVDQMDARWRTPLSGGASGYHDFVLARAGSLFGRNDTWRQSAVARTDLLLSFGTHLCPGPDFVKDAPKPDPDMRITPQL